MGAATRPITEPCALASRQRDDGVLDRGGAARVQHRRSLRTQSDAWHLGADQTVRRSLDLRPPSRRTRPAAVNLVNKASLDVLIPPLILVVAGIVVAILGRRGRQGRLPRQDWAGIRTPSTMRSDEAWRAAGILMETSGWVAAALGCTAALLFAAGLSWATVLMLAATGLLLVGVAYAGVRGVQAARRVG